MAIIGIWRLSIIVKFSGIQQWSLPLLLLTNLSLFQSIQPLIIINCIMCMCSLEKPGKKMHQAQYFIGVTEICGYYAEYVEYLFRLTI